MTVQMITNRPVTRSDVMKGLKELGVRSGMTLLVHSSMRSFGRFVPGGASAILAALTEAIGPEGTLVMPTQSHDLTDPSTWMNPPLDESWWELVREEMPAYDPTWTLTGGMGVIVETFRGLPGTERSRHPHVSLAARGPAASELLADHQLDYGLGEHSPLAKLYEADACVLLLGCRHDSNTSLHLAEYRATYNGREKITHQAPIIVDGAKVWVTYEDYNITSDDFEQLGYDFERDCPKCFTRVNIGEASCFFARQRDLVDYGVQWLSTNR
ncbi:aminoglycoside N(3)-acetyltransferase [Paenibacillus brasilensis]|uniref:Aminoglycoside N(3)-acetyltransferase n=1 Tax=Paenibacillus brasilensis TaxID=128574 RepID=A0ABU0L4F3_9BACL|nr:AAC(3) family N-acetyltransferase [Paenibacillus brasilensis]MDQ0496163.1 aminoglycoside 3-N-acetyltransferase [Paenibacillus brasilensis]